MFEIDKQSAHLFKIVVPLVPPDSKEVEQCRPIGCYVAAKHLADRYQEDR